MSKTLDQIIDSHTQEYKAGHNDALKQEILQWVADEFIGEDEVELQGYGIDGRPNWVQDIVEVRKRNDWRQDRRQILKDHGWKPEGEK